MNDSIPRKQCTKCNQYLPATIEYFAIHKRCKDGLNSQCKACVHKRRVLVEGWKKPHKTMPPSREGFKWCPKCNIELPATQEYFSPDKRGAKGLKSYCKKCTLILAYEYRANNREKYLDAKRDWRKRNPDKVKKHKSESQKRNRPSANKRMRRYDKAHPEARQMRTLMQKVRRKGAIGKAGASDYKRMLLEQDYRCAYCGIRLCPDILFDIHIEHIIAVTKGGTNDPDNLMLTCASCNHSKRDLSLVEWQAVRGW